MKNDQALIGQIGRFILVGLVSTALHFAIATYLNDIGIPAHVANFIGFLCAATWSFFGNLYFTFRAGGNLRDYIMRFCFMSFGLYLTSAICVVLINQWLGQPFIFAMATMVIASPIVSFLLQKYWVFRS